MRSKWSPKCIPRLLPNLLRKYIEMGPSRTSKTMIPLERGINFHEIQGSLKGLHFDIFLEVFWSSLVTVFCSFIKFLRVREHMQKNTEKVPKKCSKGSPRRSQSGPKIHKKSLKIEPCSQMVPRASKTEPRDLKSHQNTPQGHQNDSKMMSK